jgi:hypothetical protein
MSYGLEVQNSTGDLVIDAAFRNFEIIAEGTGTHVGSGLLAYVDITFPATAQPPLVFVRSTGYGLGCATLLRDGSGNYTTARLYSEALFNTFSFDWFVAAPADGLSGEAWGLQVFDASAKKVFDSGERYVQFREVASVSVATAFETAAGLNVEGYLPVAHAAVSTAYYCLSSLRAFISNIIFEYPATFFPTVRAYNTTTAWVAVTDRAIVGSWTPDPYTRNPGYLVVATKSA